MREFKFRAYNKTNKVMIYSRDYAALSEFWADVERARRMGMEVVVMQYVNLEDKNKTEIYEGDIVKQYFYNSMWLDVIDKVEIDPLFGTNLKLGLAGYDHEWEVIGNIYENPNLLERRKQT
jgi:uncharacterized phage protein (TIGR01671 family)